MVVDWKINMISAQPGMKSEYEYIPSPTQGDALGRVDTDDPATMVAQTRTAAAPPKKLVFNDKIVGKSLATDTLLKKLKALHTELAELDQELVDVHSLGPVRTQLINTSLLLHKDRGVKAYTACCLADVLRLYAPDAPYTQNELKDIFQFFFRQLSAGLKATDAPYYNEYFHLLESLSTVKSVVLVCDLPHADELMSEIFRELFVLVRRDLAKKIELFIADILVALIDECQSLPSDVLDAIMAQFLDKNSVRHQAHCPCLCVDEAFSVLNSPPIGSQCRFATQRRTSCSAMFVNTLPTPSSQIRATSTRRAISTKYGLRTTS